jgi:hypothetical protein
MMKFNVLLLRTECVAIFSEENIVIIIQFRIFLRAQIVEYGVF